ncbi:MAG: hypothetical protein QE265_01530 [Rhodoferax sp.]|nr:hypothetical protein [Rhodoferax sp.]
MRHPVLIAICCAVVGLMGVRATAQTIYRCGVTYSETPCGAGTTLEGVAPSKESPTERQRAAAHENQRQAKAADALENARQAQEAQAARRHQAEAQAMATDKARTAKTQAPAVPHSARKAAKSDKDPGYFTAKPPPPAKP